MCDDLRLIENLLGDIKLLTLFSVFICSEIYGLNKFRVFCDEIYVEKRVLG